MRLVCRCLLAALMAGCGARDEKLLPVSGKVLLDGSPLTLGTVTFAPDKEKGNQAADNAIGQIKPDGTYSLGYRGKMGAPAGWYKVGVNPVGMPTTMPKQGETLPTPAKINSKFTKPETSGVQVEVVASPSGDAYTIKVTK